RHVLVEALPRRVRLSGARVAGENEQHRVALTEPRAGAFVVSRREPDVELAHMRIAERIVGKELRAHLERDEPSARPARPLQHHAISRESSKGRKSTDSRL